MITIHHGINCITNLKMLKSKYVKYFLSLGYRFNNVCVLFTKSASKLFFIFFFIFKSFLVKLRIFNTTSCTQRSTLSLYFPFQVHLCEAARITDFLGDEFVVTRTTPRSMLVAVKMLRPSADDRAR